MTGPFADRLFRLTFFVAGIYNLAFGLWAAIWPLAFFQLFEIAPPRYPGIWACLGMVVGVYGLLYWHAAWKLETGWPIIAVGLLGKVLGPIGMVTSFDDDWPRRLGMICVFNDLIWWLPFGLFLVRGGWLGRKIVASAPWLCLVLHVAALVVLAAWLQPGTLIERDVATRGGYVAAQWPLWSLGWAMWMAAAVSIVGFYAWWGSYLPAKRAAIVGIALCWLGMVADFSGEGSAILRLADLVPDNLERYASVEREFTLLSPGLANGLYTLGGALLTWATPALPGWIRGTMWSTWLAGVAMTIAAIFDYVPGIVGSTAVLFPTLFMWVGWMAFRGRPV
jgi:hypothetical protein